MMNANFSVFRSIMNKALTYIYQRGTQASTRSLCAHLEVVLFGEKECSVNEFRLKKFNVFKNILQFEGI